MPCNKSSKQKISLGNSSIFAKEEFLNGISIVSSIFIASHSGKIQIASNYPNAKVFIYELLY